MLLRVVVDAGIPLFSCGENVKRYKPIFCHKCNKESQMSKHLLGSDRILHEGAGYRNKYALKSQKPPVGSRENPSNPKQEGVDAVYIPDTAKWCSKK